MATETTLLFGKPLFFLTFRTAAIHFSTTQIIFKKQTTARTLFCPGLNRSTTAGEWAFKDSPTVTAPVLPLKGFLAYQTSFCGHYLLQCIQPPSNEPIAFITNPYHGRQSQNWQEERLLIDRDTLQPMAEFFFCLFGIAKVQLE